MNNENTAAVPVWFWIVAVLALLWNAMGVFAYITDVNMSAEAIAALPQNQQELRAATPAWVTGVYAVAVFAGLLGALALLLRKGWAVPLLALSLVAVVIQMGYVMIVMKAPDVLGANAMVFPAVIIALGAVLLWFAMASKRQGRLT